MTSLFSLPPELRAQIWNNCLPGPRHILISHKLKYLQPPVLLHICHESRSEAQRHYVKAPAALYGTDGELSQWIDFKQDIICIGSEGVFVQRPGHEPTTTFRHVQRLAFEFHPPQNFIQLLEILMPVDKHLSDMPQLKEVILYSMPKKWFEDQFGRVQERQPGIAGERDFARILLRLLHMLFGGHAWLDSAVGIPPPLRWEFVSNEDADVWAGPYSNAEKHEYVFRCASTGKFEIQSMDQKQLARLKRITKAEPRVHHAPGCYTGCPEHEA